MQSRRYKPLVGRLFWITLVIVTVLLFGMTFAVIFFPDVLAISITVLVDLLTLYLILSPLFGYVELREHSVYIKLGLILTREIPYGKIRGVVKERRFYSESILSLKNALEHINIKYGAFDVVTVSVIDNDGLIEELEKRIAQISDS